MMWDCCPGLNGLLQDVRNVLRDMKHARESGVLPLCLQIGLGSCIDEGFGGVIIIPCRVLSGSVPKPKGLCAAGCLKAESKAFSACSETEAREMLEQAMLTEVQGWEQHPPDIPAGVEFGSHKHILWTFPCVILLLD